MQSENPLLNFGCTFLKLFKLGGRGGRGSKRGKTSALYDRAAGRGGGATCSRELPALDTDAELGDSDSRAAGEWDEVSEPGAR